MIILKQFTAEEVLQGIIHLVAESFPPDLLKIPGANFTASFNEDNSIEVVFYIDQSDGQKSGIDLSA